jgi:peptide deformylase
MPLELLLSSGTALPITRWGHPVLHRPSQPVTEFGPELWNLLCDMFATNTAGTLARCLQHETDYVNGIVMEDHLSPSERRDLRRQHRRVAAGYPDDDWPASPRLS